MLPIEGDITQPELAISASDRAMLARTVNIVFHSAATVKFDEKLKLSVTINMLGTQRLIELCKRMTNLQALVSIFSFEMFHIYSFLFFFLTGARLHSLLQLRPEDRPGEDIPAVVDDAGSNHVVSEYFGRANGRFAHAAVDRKPT